MGDFKFFFSEVVRLFSITYSKFWGVGVELGVEGAVQRALFLEYCLYMSTGRCSGKT